MKTIEASFEIVTPMFIGGSDIKDQPDLRPPSIKGVLRFWWRALHWGLCLQETENKKEALKRLHKSEAELFGAAANNGKYGQGVFSVKLKDAKVRDVEISWPKGEAKGAGYIGYGIPAAGNDPHKKGIKPQDFSIVLVLNKRINTTQEKQLKNTLLAWGLFGGLGARARRGFGSVAITEIDGVSYTFNNKSDYYRNIKQFIDSITLSPEMPIFTAFNTEMKIAALPNQNQSYIKLMENLGDSYKNERKDAFNASDRVVFGLPLKDVDEENRRSSPLFFHVHKLGTKHVGIFTYIPADFHHVKRHNETKMQPLFKKIDKYMDTMESIYP